MSTGNNAKSISIFFLLLGILLTVGIIMIPVRIFSNALRTFMKRLCIAKQEHQHYLRCNDDVINL